jgi:hypothetical protein
MYNRFNLGRHLVSAKIIDIFDCEPLAWLWRGFGAPLRLGKRQWQFENNLMELCHQF